MHLRYSHSYLNAKDELDQLKNLRVNEKKPRLTVLSSSSTMYVGSSRPGLTPGVAAPAREVGPDSPLAHTSGTVISTYMQKMSLTS